MLQRYLHRISLAKAVRSSSLRSNLAGVSGYTGRGDIEFSTWKSGAGCIEVSLRGVAGRSAEIFADGVFLHGATLKNGKADCRFDTPAANERPCICDGTKIEIRQNGQPILEGVLRGR